MKTKTMKKIISLMMSALIMFGLAACGKEQQMSDNGAAKPSTEATDQNEAESETSKGTAGVSSVEETESGADGTISDDVNTEDMESGKTVIPFCTSASSGLGESGKLLEEMSGTGKWLEGERFSSGVSEEDVKTWVNNLGL